MSVGEPDFITPWNIRDAAIHSIEAGRTHYTPNRGLMELRQLAVEYLKERFNLEYDAKDTLVTVGASEALDLAFRAILNPGDEVLVPAPSYVSYEPGGAVCPGVPWVWKPLRRTTSFSRPRASSGRLRRGPGPSSSPYPNNPTGAIMTREELDAILPVIEKHDLLIIADEIYAELTYGRRHVSIAEGHEDRTLLINGFSKAFAMTGWRLGYACGPKPLYRYHDENPSVFHALRLHHEPGGRHRSALE